MAKKKRETNGSKKPDVLKSAKSSQRNSGQGVSRAQRGSYERQTSPYKSSQPYRDQRPPKAPNTPNNAQPHGAQRTKPSKRRKYRGGNYTLYYIMAGIVLLVVLIILANTVLFNCTSVIVSGNVRYTEQEIIDASGLKTGENLLHINTSAAKDKIVSELVYIDDAQVKKSFPTQIKITVTEAEKRYCVNESGVTAVISQGGKIIEHGSADGLPMVKGYDAETVELGDWLKSKTSGKSEIPDKIFTAADKTGLKDITLIDMTDKFDVKVTVEDRVVLELGPADEVPQKFAVAVELLKSEIGKEEYVTINLTNPEVVPVRNNSFPQNNNTTVSSVSSPAASSDTDDPSASEEPSSSDTDESAVSETPTE